MHLLFKMWKKLTDTVKTVSSMLNSGAIPPNTPIEYREDFKKINFLASKKFYVVFCSIVILSIFYASSIGVLFLTSIYPSLTIPFVSIFSETIKILAIIIGSYLGVQTVLDYKMQSSNNVTLIDESISVEEKLTYIDSNAKEEGYEL